MSQIAAALARSKGKKVEPVPSGESVVPSIHTSNPPMPGAPAAVAPKKKPPVLVIAGGGVAALVLAGAGWFAFRPKPPPPAPAPARIQPAPKPVAAAPVVLPAPEPAPATTAPEAVESVFTPEMQERLTKLVVTARRTGSEQRIVVAGKVYLPGDVVLEGVFLEAVLPDKIVFRDSAKQRFERR